MHLKFKLLWIFPVICYPKNFVILFLQFLRADGPIGLEIFTAGPVIGIGMLVVMNYLMIFWGVPAESPGTKWFYIYQEGYKALFR